MLLEFMGYHLHPRRRREAMPATHAVVKRLALAEPLQHNCVARFLGQAAIVLAILCLLEI